MKALVCILPDWTATFLLINQGSWNHNRIVSDGLVSMWLFYTAKFCIFLYVIVVGPFLRGYHRLVRDYDGSFRMAQFGGLSLPGYVNLSTWGGHTSVILFLFSTSLSLSVSLHLLHFSPFLECLIALRRERGGGSGDTIAVQQKVKSSAHCIIFSSTPKDAILCCRNKDKTFVFTQSGMDVKHEKRKDIF